MEFSVEGYAILREDMKDYVWISQRLSEFDQATAFGPVVAAQHIFVARSNDHDERLGGCVTSCRFGWMHIEKLWVDADHRGRGIGDRLLDTAEKLAAINDLLDVRLVTTTRHTGLPLYQRRGFTVDYRLRGRLDDGSHLEKIGLSKRSQKTPASSGPKNGLGGGLDSIKSIPVCETERPPIKVGLDRANHTRPRPVSSCLCDLLSR